MECDLKLLFTRFTRDLNEKNIHVDATVVEEMQRLQKNMKLITSFKVLSEPSNYISLLSKCSIFLQALQLKLL